MLENELVVSTKQFGNLTQIETENTSVRVTQQTIDTLIDCNLSKEEAYEIIAYLKERHELSSVEDIVDFSEIYITELCTSLLELFSYDEVLLALNEIDDNKLFGLSERELRQDPTVVMERKKVFILNLVKAIRSYETDIIYTETGDAIEKDEDSYNEDYYYENRRRRG